MANAPRKGEYTKQREIGTPFPPIYLSPPFVLCSTILPSRYDVSHPPCPAFLIWTDLFNQVLQLPRYVDQRREILARTRESLEIHVDDIDDAILKAKVLRNTNHYLDVAASALDAFFTEDDLVSTVRNPFDEVMRQRMARLRELHARGGEVQGSTAVSKHMLRQYEVRFVPPAAGKLMRLRDVGARNIGELVSIRGVVTRCTDVQPQIQVQSYMCASCGEEVFQEIDAAEYIPLRECPSEACRVNNVKGRLEQHVVGSKFVRVQEMRLQELPFEVPIGHVPRTLVLRAHGDMVRRCKPGDVVTVAGVFLPQFAGGFRSRGSPLTMDTYVEVHGLKQSKKMYTELQLSPEEEQRIAEEAADPDIFAKLANSLSPEIYGHLDIKKAMILALVGGVTKTMSDGLRIRGDINVILVGDPGMAKSQLLKHVTKVAARSVYTTGKGSSGVGLTAAVLRDPATGDMTLEGGALVLADQGVCCIDEFDKMDESDRTAIHEVMEQQTVSIAKAGITTTLNARTTVLAAANPAYGRYNLRESPARNLDMPAALLSRFDLLFVMIDRPDTDSDLKLAQHITYVHRHSTHPPLEHAPLSAQFLREYVSRAKAFEPTIPRELTDFIGTQYVDLRVASNATDQRVTSQAAGPTNPRGDFCTARSLLSILRLSQAVARVHMRDEVTQEDVEEAIRLVNVTRDTIEAEERERSQNNRPRDRTTAIWTYIEGTLAGNKMVPKRQIDELLRRKGFSEDDIAATYRQYEALNVISIAGEFVVYV